MGKITLRGPVPKDDPMFSGGPEIFSRRESSASATTSASGTAGATPEPSLFSDAGLPPPPDPEQFATQAERDEALNAWLSHVTGIDSTQGKKKP